MAFNVLSMGAARFCSPSTHTEHRAFTNFHTQKNVELQETSCELTSAQSLVSACQPNTN